MNVFVTNISTRIKEDHLKQLFEAFGQVASVKILKDKATGISKGTAFVKMKNNEGGTSVIGRLNGVEFDGKILRVQKAREVSGNKKLKF